MKDAFAMFATIVALALIYAWFGLGAVLAFVFGPIIFAAIVLLGSLIAFACKRPEKYHDEGVDPTNDRL